MRIAHVVEEDGLLELDAIGNPCESQQRHFRRAWPYPNIQPTAANIRMLRAKTG